MAVDFFTAGVWAEIADSQLIAEQLRREKLIDKQIAHLTMTRPHPKDKYVYRPDSFLHLVDDLLKLLDQFAAAADPRLMPDWWTDWAANLTAMPWRRDA